MLATNGQRLVESWSGARLSKKPRVKRCCLNGGSTAPNPDQEGSVRSIVARLALAALATLPRVTHAQPTPLPNPIGTPNDRGFAESGVSNTIEQYGDIGHVLSTYEKHIWGDTQVRGRGINSFQMVRKDGRWWITSLIWDEETGAGPVPAKYLPRR